MSGRGSVQYPLGRCRGLRFHLHGRLRARADPSRDFAVVVYTPLDDESVQIARVDDAHGYTHFDRLYRRDLPKERVDWDFWEAVSRLSADWRQYAEQHPVTD